MPTPVIDDVTSIPALKEGCPYTHQFNSAPAADAWSAQGLPAGLSIDANGLLTGTPTAAGAGVWSTRLTATAHIDRAMTAAAGTDLLTSAGHPLANDNEVEFGTDDTLPAPLQPATTYYVRDVSGDDYKVAARIGGPAIDITDAGTGLHFVRQFDPSDELLVVFGVEQLATLIESGDLTIEANVDLNTRAITFLGIPELPYHFGPPSSVDLEAEEQAATLSKVVHMLLKRGDRFPMSFGFTRIGQLQDLDIATLKVMVSEFEPERKFQINGNTFEKLGSGTTTRYKTQVYIDPAKFTALLSNYEEDEGTYFNANSEVQTELVATAEAPTTYDRTITHNINLTGDADITKLFNFSDLPESVSAPYDATMKLVVQGRGTQDVTLDRKDVVTWDGANFAIAEVTGPSSDQGDDETPHWRATFSNSANAGDNNGIDISTRVETTGQDEWLLNLPLCNLQVNQAGTALEVIAQYGIQEDTNEISDGFFQILETITLDDGDTPAALLAEWNALASFDDADDVRFENGQVWVVWAAEPTTGPPQFAEEYSCSSISELFHRPTGPNYPAVMSVRLLGEEDAPSAPAPERVSSQTFKLRIERDQSPDTE